MRSRVRRWDAGVQKRTMHLPIVRRQAALPATFAVWYEGDSILAVLFQLDGGVHHNVLCITKYSAWGVRGRMKADMHRDKMVTGKTDDGAQRRSLWKSRRSSQRLFC